MDIISVVKGNSTVVKEITISGYSTLDSNWTGKKQVKTMLGAATKLVDATLDKDDGNTKFLGYLTPTETDALTPGEVYYMVFEITNTTISPKFTRELQYKLRVKESGIS